MTFHVVPTVFDQGMGICLSETVAVTVRGVEVITRFPRELITGRCQHPQVTRVSATQGRQSIGNTTLGQHRMALEAFLGAPSTW